ncbi:hypothetical protein E3C22_20285 [Jiella endophytica]|uniref:Uncharacterized protein n=1 Tax=Jiella endophytica TaxID=2558362 RepID=A0A4Y8RBC0_9HYPH|nr:hypothetical protein [Jiella endophytica]TFF19113.1 hypothetical protein E3C22_20285 [Jiella endophytica]
MARRIRLAIGAALAMALAPCVAAAEGWGTATPPGALAGTRVCDDAAGCFGLVCRNKGAADFFVQLPAGRTVEGAVALAMAVDRESATTLGFEPAASSPDALVARFDESLEGLVRRLREGSAVMLRSRIPGFDYSGDFSLKGSAEEIDRVLSACNDSTADESAIAAYKAEFDDMCRSANGGSVSFSADAAKRQTVAGTDFVVFNTANGECTPFANAFCGSGGCQIAVFMAEGGAFRKVFETLAYEIDVVSQGGRPTLQASVHGSACNRSGAEGCTEIYSWNGRKFQLVSQE